MYGSSYNPNSNNIIKNENKLRDYSKQELQQQIEVINQKITSLQSELNSQIQKAMTSGILKNYRNDQDNNNNKSSPLKNYKDLFRAKLNSRENLDKISNHNSISRHDPNHPGQFQEFNDKQNYTGINENNNFKKSSRKGSNNRIKAEKEISKDSPIQSLTTGDSFIDTNNNNQNGNDINNSFSGISRTDNSINGNNTLKINDSLDIEGDSSWSQIKELKLCDQSNLSPNFSNHQKKEAPNTQIKSPEYHASQLDNTIVNSEQKVHSDSLNKELRNYNDKGTTKIKYYCADHFSPGRMNQAGPFSKMELTLESSSLSWGKRKSNSPIRKSTNLQAKRDKSQPPIDISQIEKNTEEDDLYEMTVKLGKIFEYYVTSNLETSRPCFNLQTFHRIIIDANLLDDHLTQKELDLLYLTLTRNKPQVDFNKFMELFKKIARKKFKNIQGNKKIMQLLMDNYFYPLFNKLFNDNTNTYRKINDIEIDETIKNILLNNGDLLYKIYCGYFPWEINQNSLKSFSSFFPIKQLTENNIMELIKDMNILGNMIPKKAFEEIFNNIISMESTTLTQIMKINISHDINKSLSSKSQINSQKNNDIGIYFTFNKYIWLLIKVANAITKPIHSDANNDKKYELALYASATTAEKLYYLLQKMEELTLTSSNLSKEISNQKYSKLSPSVNHDMISKSIDESSIIVEDKHNLANPKENKLEINSMNNIDNPFMTNHPDKKPKNSSIFSNSLSKYNELIKTSNASLEEIHGLYSISDNENISKKNRNSDPSNIDLLQSRADCKINQERIPAIFKTKLGNLKRIFQYYASYGEPMNTTSLKYLKFKKLLKDCDLMKTSINNSKKSLNKPMMEEIIEDENSNINRRLYSHDAEVIFLNCIMKDNNNKPETISTTIQNSPLKDINRKSSKSPNKSPSPNKIFGHGTSITNTYKIEFTGFIRSIYMIAIKLYPEEDISHAISLIIEKKLLKLDDDLMLSLNETERSPESKPLNNITELMKDPQMLDFIEAMNKTLSNYYRLYSDSKGLMAYEQFYKFCKDFNIFPEIITKQKLASFFKALVKIYGISTSPIKKCESNNNTTSLIELYPEIHYEDKINQELFLDGLILCALEIPFTSAKPTPIQKICYLLERMNVSDGIRKISNTGLTKSTYNSSWDLLYHIKKKYPDLFSKKIELRKKDNDFVQAMVDMIS